MHALLERDTNFYYIIKISKLRSEKWRKDLIEGRARASVCVCVCVCVWGGGGGAEPKKVQLKRH